MIYVVLVYVNIIVYNLNDNLFWFENLEYRFVVYEDVLDGILVGVVVVKDVDYDVIIYLIIGGSGFF